MPAGYGQAEGVEHDNRPHLVCLVARVIQARRDDLEEDGSRMDGMQRAQHLQRIPACQSFTTLRAPLHGQACHPRYMASVIKAH